ncbi:uncharacterized transposon-derived protein F54H12.3 [Trichonephila clavipes]|nr:uncharacterized transposon-derived protein F54H12.3 [Trichonephila clavipes]
MTTCIPGIALQQFQVKKKQDLLHMEFYHHLPSWALNEQMSYFSSFSDKWSRDLKTAKEFPVVFKHRNSVHVEPEHPGSFCGVEALFRAMDGKVSRKNIKKWLSAKDSYTLHKPIKKKFKKYRVFYAWAISLPDKNAKTVVSAFEQIFPERVPLKLQTDAGKESTRTNFSELSQKEENRFFHDKEEYETIYIDVVDKLVYSYNNTWHRSIQMTPASVTETNQSQRIVYRVRLFPFRWPRPRLNHSSGHSVFKRSLQFLSLGPWGEAAPATSIVCVPRRKKAYEEEDAEDPRRCLSRHCKPPERASFMPLIISDWRE